MAEKLEHEALEKDIERLSQEVQERKEASAEKPPEAAVREALKERIYPTPPSVAAPPTPPADTTSQVLPAYLQKESPEVKLKVEELIDFTLHQGIDKAVEEARKYGPFVLDALHDALTAKLYEELKSRGLL